jgi:hypothetical protein
MLGPDGAPVLFLFALFGFPFVPCSTLTFLGTLGTLLHLSIWPLYGPFIISLIRFMYLISDFLFWL